MYKRQSIIKGNLFFKSEYFYMNLNSALFSSCLRKKNILYCQKNYFEVIHNDDKSNRIVQA